MPAASIIHWVGPLLSFQGGLVKGVCGTGEVILFSALWQALPSLGYNEFSNFDLMVAAITFQQTTSIIAFALILRKAWVLHLKSVIIFALLVMAGSPVGMYIRRNLEILVLRSVLAILFLVVGLTKMWMNATDHKSLQIRVQSESSATEVQNIQTEASSCASEQISKIPATKIGTAFEEQIQEQEQDEGREQTVSKITPKQKHVTTQSEAYPSENSQPGINNLGTQIVHQVDLEEHKIILKKLWKPFVLTGFLSGIGCGLAGLGGPCLMIFTALTHFPKRLTRIFGTSNGIFETPFRLFVCLLSTYPEFQEPNSTSGPLKFTWEGDLPFLLSCCLASQVGLFLGDKIAIHINQNQFEWIILWVVILAALAALGLFEGAWASFLGLGVVMLVSLRSVWICRSKEDGERKSCVRKLLPCV